MGLSCGAPQIDHAFPLSEARPERAQKAIRKEPYGALVYVRDPAMTIKMTRPEAEGLLGLGPPYPDDLTAPEVCHISLTEACNRRCPYCYLGGGPSAEEMDTSALCRVLDDMADSGLIQVTFGGGEPLLREDVLELAEHAVSRGLNVSMTTNADYLDRFPVGRFSVFSQVNITAHDACADELALRTLTARVEALQEATAVGLNVVAWPRLHDRAGLLGRLAAERHMSITLLEPKPTPKQALPRIDRKAISTLHRLLLAEGATVRLECSLVGSCPAGIRFMNVRSDGCVTPCVFLTETYGNLCEQPLPTVWDAMRHLRPGAVVRSLEGVRPKGELLCASR